MELIERLNTFREAIELNNKVSAQLIDETIATLQELEDEAEREFYRGHRVGYKFGYEAGKRGYDEKSTYIDNCVGSDDANKSGSR